MNDNNNHICGNCIECHCNYLGCYCNLSDIAIDPSDEACIDYIPINEDEDIDDE